MSGFDVLIFTAAIVLFVVGCGWWVWQKKRGEDPSEQVASAAEKGAGVLAWLDFRIINGLTINPVLILIWFGGNVWFGNLYALLALIEWFNTLNDGHVSFPYSILLILATFPSLMQWSLQSRHSEHRQASESQEGELAYDWVDWSTWGLIGFDILFSTFGYWRYWQMPVDFDRLYTEHFIALLLFVGFAYYCNVYAEASLHRSLENFINALKSILKGKSTEVPVKEKSKVTKKKATPKGGKAKQTTTVIDEKQLEETLKKMGVVVNE